MTIGERIKKRRIELNLTQDEFAERVGYTHRSAVSKVEKNRVIPPIDKVELFAKVLHCSPIYLAGWTEDTGNVKTEAERLEELENRVARLEEVLNAKGLLK